MTVPVAVPSLAPEFVAIRAVVGGEEQRTVDVRQIFPALNWRCPA